MQTIELPAAPTLPAIEKQKLKTIYNPEVIKNVNPSAQLMRIVQEARYTRIDFVYYAPLKYTNGGWVCMERYAFIRPVGEALKLYLLDAVNIPLAPDKHYFRHAKESLYYTLYFPALPKDVTHIDIIECEGKPTSDREHGGYFNFYGVSLEKIARQVLVAF